MNSCSVGANQKYMIFPSLRARSRPYYRRMKFLLESISECKQLCLFINFTDLNNYELIKGKNIRKLKILRLNFILFNQINVFF